VNADGYLEGAPELVAEVSLSREAIDLGAKKRWQNEVLMAREVRWLPL
jgi:hypothetical protein